MSTFLYSFPVWMPYNKSDGILSSLFPGISGRPPSLSYALLSDLLLFRVESNTLWRFLSLFKVARKASLRLDVLLSSSYDVSSFRFLTSSIIRTFRSLSLSFCLSSILSWVSCWDITNGLDSLVLSGVCLILLGILIWRSRCYNSSLAKCDGKCTIRL